MIVSFKQDMFSAVVHEDYGQNLYLDEVSDFRHGQYFRARLVAK